MKKKAVARSKKTAVTFEMPANIQAEGLWVAGDFNDWSTSAAPMKRLKDGGWSTTLNLDPGTYRYRIVADGNKWLNDPTADRFEPSGFGEDNSVVEINGAS